MCFYSESLEQLLINAGIGKKPTYTTGNISTMLNISRNMVIMLCDQWEPETLQGLESYRVGTHRRIPHHAVVEWLTHNSNYAKLGE